MAKSRAEVDRIVADLRKRIGTLGDPVRLPVEAGHLAQFASATGHAPEGPQSAAISDTGALPTFVSLLTNLAFENGPLQTDLPFDMFLHTDDAVTLGRPLRVGDVAHAQARYVDAFMRSGRKGLMVFQHADVEVTTATGDPVATIRVGMASFDLEPAQ